MHDHHYVRFANDAGCNFSYYFTLWVPRKHRRLKSDQRVVCLSSRSRTRVIAYNFNHRVQCRIIIIIKKKNITLHYSNVTCAARPGEYKRVRACAVAAARATPPSISRRHRRRRRRRRHNLILSVTRVARYRPSGVRPLNGFINTHIIIHDVLFIRMYIYRYNMHTTVVFVVVVFVTIIITITFVKIDA